jgi:hypothetical protein
VHNDRVIARLRPGPAAALLLSSALVLAGCSGSGSSSPQTGPGSSGSSKTSSQGQSSAPTTTDGSSLPVPQGATVAWQPDQKTVGVIKMAVTRQQQVPVRTFRDFRLDRATRRSTPYFVHVTVKNLGPSDLSHVPVPLYLLDQQHTLLQASTFQAQFPACPSRPLPAKFKRGSHTTVCLVYFVPKHGKLVSMSFRPSEDYDAITWHGAVQKPKHGKG